MGWRAVLDATAPAPISVSPSLSLLSPPCPLAPGPARDVDRLARAARVGACVGLAPFSPLPALSPSSVVRCCCSFPFLSLLFRLLLLLLPLLPLLLPHRW